MIFAELLGKLGLAADNAERSEDALTSTVFGTLLIGRGTDLLIAWFSRARTEDGSQFAFDKPPDDRRDPGYWFWPNLPGAQPDLVLELDERIFLIEAKFLSGASDRTADEGLKSQLAAEWRALGQASAGAGALASSVRSSKRNTLLYVVSAASLPRSIRDLAAAREELSSRFDAYVLTWQDLHAVLHARRGAAAVPAWEAALRHLLERRGLASFTGFARMRSGEAQHVIAPRLSRVPRPFGFRGSILTDLDMKRSAWLLGRGTRLAGGTHGK